MNGRRGRTLRARHSNFRAFKEADAKKILAKKKTFRALPGIVADDGTPVVMGTPVTAEEEESTAPAQCPAGRYRGATGGAPQVKQLRMRCGKQHLGAELLLQGGWRPFVSTYRDSHVLCVER